MRINCVGAWRRAPVSAVRAVLIVASLGAAGSSIAGGQMPTTTGMHDMERMAGMQSPLGVSMDRMGSGTSWIPDDAAIPTEDFMAGSWDVMLHGSVFGQYDRQGGNRGDSQFGSINWGMLMATHDLAVGRFQARTMLRLDPWTVSNRGYPLLAQSGEAIGDEPIHDRQHPHDFLMELIYVPCVGRRSGLAQWGRWT